MENKDVETSIDTILIGQKIGMKRTLESIQEN